MAKRKIIKIDTEKCNGCGLCMPNCPEGAIQMIDGKARLISDLFCDGLGACLGSCPEGAIEIEEREAQKYDEKKVMENIVKQGSNTITAHLNHLKDHGERIFLKEAIEFLKENKIEMPKQLKEGTAMKKEHTGCPGMQIMNFGDSKDKQESISDQPSYLRQWPVQLHLVSPRASYFQNQDILLAADCVAYSVGNFHSKFLKGKSLVIACPKLDSNLDVYTEKLIALIDESNINTLTVMTMEVPCCTGLLQIAIQAAQTAKRLVPLKHITVGIQGDILKEEWISINK